MVGGRYGLASKDTTPGQIVAVYDNLAKEEPKNSFTIGIEDDVTFTSLPYEEIALDYPGQVSCKIWGLGGDGTVGANKNAITTIGLAADKYAQAYFSYDSMKSGGLTQSHLRFGDQPIHATYLVSAADFVGVHAPTYVDKYDTTADLKDGGTYLLNCPWSAEELEERLPAKMKRDLANKYAQAYFSYDSMKSGGLTQSHLRFGDEPIRSTYLVSSADFVAVHAPTYVNKYDTTEDLKDGGIFLLNCPWSAEELETRLPGKMKRDLARKHANFYIIDAAKLAVQVGLGEKRTNNILQAAFFALTKVIPLDMAEIGRAHV